MSLVVDWRLANRFHVSKVLLHHSVVHRVYYRTVEPGRRSRVLSCEILRRLEELGANLVQVASARSRGPIAAAKAGHGEVVRVWCRVAGGHMKHHRIQRGHLRGASFIAAIFDHVAPLGL